MPSPLAGGLASSPRTPLRGRTLHSGWTPPPSPPALGPIAGALPCTLACALPYLFPSAWKQSQVSPKGHASWIQVPFTPPASVYTAVHLHQLHDSHCTEFCKHEQGVISALGKPMAPGPWIGLLFPPHMAHLSCLDGSRPRLSSAPDRPVPSSHVSPCSMRPPGCREGHLSTVCPVAPA